MKFKYKLVEEYSTEINRVEASEKEMEEKQNKVRKEMYDAIEELEKKIKAIRKPYEKKEQELNQSEKRYCHLKYELQAEKQKFIENQEVMMAQEAGEHTEESALALLKLKDIYGGGRGFGDTFNFKKTLDNGIKIFREFDDGCFTKLYAFKGLQLVGFWRKRKSEHAGDETYGEAFIGHKKLNEDKELAQQMWKPLEKKSKNGSRYGQEENHPLYRKTGYHSRTDPTQVQFIAYIKDNPKKLVAIDLEDKENCKFMQGSPRW